MKENGENTAIDKNDIVMHPSVATAVVAERQRQPEAQSQKPQAPNARKSLRDLVKESNNQKALEIQGKIDELRKARESLINEIKDYRRKLEYKEAENIAISKFIESKKDSIQTKKIGYLKKQKNRFEFKLSTQARISLSEEKDIIRKISEINSELEVLLKFVKLERKINYIKDDITNYTSKLNETDKKIKDIDLQLDDLYRSLRNALGIKPHGANEQYKSQKKSQPQPMQEINMEDIAVIKKKVQKKEEE